MSSYNRMEPTKSGRKYLRRHSMLAKLDKASFERIYEQLEWIHLAPGCRLFEQNSQGTDLYIVISGRLGVVVENPDGSSELVGEIKPGESIGEMSILTDSLRSATVIAMRDSILVSLSKANFRKLIETHPDTLLMMNQVLVERLRDSIHPQTQTRTTKTFSIIPISPRFSGHEFSRVLADDLSDWGHVLHLSRNNLTERLGIPIRAFDDETVSQIAIWLHEKEQEYDYILLEGDETETAWTDFCVRHSDSILLLANASKHPRESINRRYQTKRLPVSSTREMVLLHPDTVKSPTGTREWLDTYPVDTHYHVRLGFHADRKRLVRFLTGNAISLALSGGGALGMAHIGVIHALAEHKVPVDLACGASAGANIAAQLVCGWGHQRIADQTKAAFPQHLFLDLNVPLVSLLRTRMLRTGFQTIFGDLCIEDLWSKFYCSASNLTHAKIELLDRGLLWKQLMASGALPGFYPPYTDEQGDLLVDGAILDNLPALHTEKYCHGKTIAVNVIPTLDMNICNGLPAKESSLGMLASYMSPFQKASYPNIFHIALRSAFLHGIYDAEKIKQSVDLYIEPPLEQFSFLSMSSFDNIVKLGYHSAYPAIETWIASDSEVQRIIALNQA